MVWERFWTHKKMFHRKETHGMVWERFHRDFKFSNVVGEVTKSMCNSDMVSEGSGTILDRLPKVSERHEKVS